ncbi:hypothetical protein [Stappia indica]|uniref:hypothetical protein n=1 Tax=Stappia indica TaxID=538381 RepID=UPI001CD470E7|nr:hypothetical protein [Stappia indica]MCA1300577.1 hypothetical protein [Stappia indica]
MSAEEFRRLDDLASAFGKTRSDFLRDVLVAHMESKPVAAVRVRSVLSAGDKQALATYSRHAGRLAGTLIQTAKAARLGGLSKYHAEVENLLKETLKLKRRIDHIPEAQDP